MSSISNIFGKKAVKSFAEQLAEDNSKYIAKLKELIS